MPAFSELPPSMYWHSGQPQRKSIVDRGFPHVALFYNPGNKYRDKRIAFRQALQNLTGAYPIRITEHATNGNLADDIEQLDALSTPETATAVLGGDGTVSTHLQAQLARKRAHKPVGPTLILPAGSTNDIGNQLVDSWSLRHLGDMLGDLQLRDIHAMHMKATEANGATTEQDYFGYGSWGDISGGGAANLNSAEYRTKLAAARTSISAVALKHSQVARALVNAKPFIWTPEGGEPHSLYDLLVVSGSRMAGKMHFPTRLHAEEARVITAGSKLGAVATALALANGVPIGHPLSTPLRFSAEAERELIAEFDGEDRSYKGRTDFELDYSVDTLSLVVG